jgi:hypothetical protein
VLMGQLIRWMAGAGVAAEDLGPARIEEFFDSWRAEEGSNGPGAGSPAPPFAGGRGRWPAAGSPGGAAGGSA